MLKNLIYSTIHNNDQVGHGHARSKFMSPQAWTAGNGGKHAGEWMMMDLDRETFIKGLVIQKRGDAPWTNQYVTNISVSFFSSEAAKNAGVPDRAIYAGPTDSFEVSYDGQGKAQLDFEQGVYARYVKITVNGFNEYISMTQWLKSVFWRK